MPPGLFAVKLTNLSLRSFDRGRFADRATLVCRPRVAVSAKLVWQHLSAGMCSRADPSEHQLVDLVSPHAYQRDGIDLGLAQAAPSERSSFVWR